MTIDIPDTDELAQTIDALLDRAEALDDHSRETALDLAEAIESFHRAGLIRLTQLLTRDHGDAYAAFREAATDPLVYTLLRRHGLIKPSQQEQVLMVLEALRPNLHDADVELMAINPPGEVVIRLLGEAAGDAQQHVEQALYEHCDWLESVVTERAIAASEIPVVQIVTPTKDREAVQ